MKVIGLCGGSGSGKGAVCDILSERFIPSIDTDRVYHRITSEDSPCLRELVGAFGESIIDSNGALDRSVLRNIVFGTVDAEKKRKTLNEIAHKHILAETRRIIAEKRGQGAIAVIVDAPLLYESGFDKECDVTVCVVADESVRIDRIVQRDGISVEDAKKRIRGQISCEELICRSDFVLENNDNIDVLRVKVQDLFDKIIK